MRPSACLSNGDCVGREILERVRLRRSGARKCSGSLKPVRVFGDKRRDSVSSIGNSQFMALKKLHKTVIEAAT